MRAATLLLLPNAAHCAYADFSDVDRMCLTSVLLLCCWVCVLVLVPTSVARLVRSVLQSCAVFSPTSTHAASSERLALFACVATQPLLSTCNT